jgi:hypothetical protein
MRHILHHIVWICVDVLCYGSVLYLIFSISESSSWLIANALVVLSLILICLFFAAGYWMKHSITVLCSLVLLLLLVMEVIKSGIIYRWADLCAKLIVAIKTALDMV